MNVIIICGPTATGKSQLAIKLAQSTKGHIINADSIQFYQGLKIGSAAPSDHDLAQVPHHLFHVLAYPETATVGWFYRTVMNKLYELQAQEVPFVFIVGGSGFYLQTLEKGLLPVTPHNHEVRLQLEREKTTKGLGSLYEELCARDPQWAKRINPNDAYRIVRALEILRQHNKSLTQIQKEYETQSHPFPFPLLKLGLKADKNWLLNRVEQRVHQMIQNGLLEEVEGFILRQQQDWPALKAVGYKECLAFLSESESNLDDLKNKIVKNTMALIKKQVTWLKRDLKIHWLDAHSAELLSQAKTFIFSSQISS